MKIIKGFITSSETQENYKMIRKTSLIQADEDKNEFALS